MTLYEMVLESNSWNKDDEGANSSQVDNMIIL